MHKITFLVPSPNLVPVVQEVFTEDSRKGFFKETIPALDVYTSMSPREIPRQVLEADIVITRGMIAKELKQIQPDIPMIEVPIGGELIATAARAIRENGNLPMTVIGSRNMCHAAEGIQDAFPDVDLTTVLQHSRERHAIARDVDNALAKGRAIIICGIATYEYAITRQCHAYTLGMSKSSIMEAFAMAREEMMVRRREREKAAQFQAVLSAAQEGIIATDTDGRITAFNQVASELLTLSPAVALDRDIALVLPISSFPPEFTLHSQALHAFLFKDGKLSVQKCAVMRGQDLRGYVYTLMPLAKNTMARQRKLASETHYGLMVRMRQQTTDEDTPPTEQQPKEPT